MFAATRAHPHAHGRPVSPGPERIDSNSAGAVRRLAAAGYAANSKRVPTLFWMNASGKRAARAWVARQPVQCAGTR